MGLETVAEGVETAAQWSVLRETGCERIQGFLFSPAVPFEKLAETLARIEAGAQGANMKTPVQVCTMPAAAPGKLSSASQTVPYESAG